MIAGDDDLVGGRQAAICSECRGRGEITALVYSAHCAPQLLTMPCNACVGAGELTGARPVWNALGRAHRERRVRRGESLGACALRLGLAPRELVDMEHGRADPRRLADA